MDYSCPRCLSSLKENPPVSVPLPRQRRFLWLKTGFACRSCSQRVRINLHPIERGTSLAFIGCLILLAVVSYIEANGHFLLTGIIVTAAANMLLVTWTRRHLRTWRRYICA